MPVLTDAELAAAWLKPIHENGGDELPGTLHLVFDPGGATDHDTALDDDDDIDQEWCDALEVMSSGTERALSLMVEILHQSIFEADFASVSPWLAEYLIGYHERDAKLIRSSLASSQRFRGYVVSWIVESLEGLSAQRLDSIANELMTRPMEASDRAEVVEHLGPWPANDCLVYLLDLLSP